MSIVQTKTGFNHSNVNRIPICQFSERYIGCWLSVITVLTNRRGLSQFKIENTPPRNTLLQKRASGVNKTSWYLIIWLGIKMGSSPILRINMKIFPFKTICLYYYQTKHHHSNFQDTKFPYTTFISNIFWK